MMARRRQAGSTMVVALVMLVILIMLGISAASGNLFGLRMVGNAQTVAETDAATQQAIEETLSNFANFDSNLAQMTVPVDQNGDGAADFQVTVRARRCLAIRDVTEGYGIEAPKPREALWEVVAEAQDAGSGARSVIHQGVSIRGTPSMTCPE